MILVTLLGLCAASASSQMIETPIKVNQLNKLTTSSSRPSRFQTLYQMNTTESLDYPLTNYFDVQLSMNLSVGTPGETYAVLFDTGSKDMWLVSDTCQVCEGVNNFFSANESSTYYGNTNHTSSNRYVSGYCEGYQGTDVVCLDSNSTCVDDFVITFVTSWEEFGELGSDGLIGFSPAEYHYPWSRSPYKNDDHLLMNALYNQGVIDDRVFSLSIGNTAQNSTVTIGGYSAEKYATSEMQWHPITYWYQWGIQGNGMHLGDNLITNRTQELLVDSGSSYIVLPGYEFNTIIDMLSQLSPCYQEAWGGINVIYCEQSNTTSSNDTLVYPDLIFSINGTNYTVSSDTYVQERTEDFEEDIPEGQVMIKLLNVDGWETTILGINFFQNYYVAFDMDNQAVGLAQSVYKSSVSSKQVISMLQIDADTQTSTDQKDQLIALAVLGVIMYICVAIYNTCVPKGTTIRNRKDENIVDDITSVGGRISHIISPKSNDDAFFRTS